MDKKYRTPIFRGMVSHHILGSTCMVPKTTIMSAGLTRYHMGLSWYLHCYEAFGPQIPGEGLCAIVCFSKNMVMWIRKGEI